MGTVHKKSTFMPIIDVSRWFAIINIDLTPFKMNKCKKEQFEEWDEEFITCCNKKSIDILSRSNDEMVKKK